MKKLILAEKINNKIKAHNLSQVRLAKLIDYDDACINAMILGKKSFPKHLVEKILPILEIAEEDFYSWILADKYPKKVIELAIKAKKEHEDKSKPILAAKIDEILKEKGMSRTQLAKQIKYPQSSFNRAVIGKENMSKNLVQKLSPAIDKSPDEIQSWIIADKYSIKFLNKALTAHTN
jgi:plasmid maintenance system antidote protein VapI